MIRPATRADARAIAQLEVRAWRWAFADLVADGDLPTVEEREARWAGGPLDRAAVWDQDGQVVGVVDADAAAGELRGLYVDPAAQGAGIGAALHDHAATALPDGATLWVFAGHGQAREFFGARGWRPDGGRRDGVGGLELRYTRRG
jgi:GNAT superfamily N-acetyltransferase